MVYSSQLLLKQKKEKKNSIILNCDSNFVCLIKFDFTELKKRTIRKIGVLNMIDDVTGLHLSSWLVTCCTDHLHSFSSCFFWWRRFLFFVWSYLVNHKSCFLNPPHQLYCDTICKNKKFAIRVHIVDTGWGLAELNFSFLVTAALCIHSELKSWIVWSPRTGCLLQCFNGFTTVSHGSLTSNATHALSAQNTTYRMLSIRLPTEVWCVSTLVTIISSQ